MYYVFCLSVYLSHSLSPFSVPLFSLSPFSPPLFSVPLSSLLLFSPSFLSSLFWQITADQSFLDKLLETTRLTWALMSSINILTVGKLREPRWRMLICLGVLGDDEQFYTLWNVNYFRESCSLVPRVLSLIVSFPPSPTVFSVRYFAAVPNGRTKFRNWVRQKYGVGIEVFN